MGRIRVGNRWGIIDRARGLARTVFVEEEEQDGYEENDMYKFEEEYERGEDEGE